MSRATSLRRSPRAPMRRSIARSRFPREVSESTDSTMASRSPSEMSLGRGSFGSGPLSATLTMGPAVASKPLAHRNLA